MKFKRKYVIFSLFFIVFITSMFANLLYVNDVYGEEDEDEDKIEGVWNTYDEGSDKFRFSSESIFLIASQNSFFGLVEGEEHTFLCIAEIKAQEYEEEIEENSNQTETESLDDDEDKYTKLQYSVIKGISDPVVRVGAEEDDWHVEVVYEFKHSVLTATYYHSKVNKGAYLEIKILYDSRYDFERYDVGYLIILDGDYEELMCEEIEKDGEEIEKDESYCNLKIKL